MEGAMADGFVSVWLPENGAAAQTVVKTEPGLSYPTEVTDVCETVLREGEWETTPFCSAVVKEETITDGDNKQVQLCSSVVSHASSVEEVVPARFDSVWIPESRAAAQPGVKKEPGLEDSIVRAEVCETVLQEGKLETKSFPTPLTKQEDIGQEQEEMEDEITFEEGNVSSRDYQVEDSQTVQTGLLHWKSETTDGASTSACQQAPVAAEEEKTTRIVKPHKCDVCGRRFRYRGLLATHIRLHTGERPFACELCDKRFTQKDYLAGHMRTHSGERPHRCPHCGKSYSTGGILTMHLRIHSGLKNYKCSHCPKEFVSRGDLTRHVRIHSGVKPYACHECQKSFSDSSALICHLKSHSGVKPFACQECGKGFSRREHLKLHINTHANNKPYKCPECKKGFNSNCNLKRHLRTHIGENKCNICGKCFKDTGALYRHVKRYHKGMEPLVCQHCGECFSNDDEYKVHCKSHDTNQLFKCDECEMCFMSSYSLTRHLWTHTL